MDPYRAPTRAFLAGQALEPRNEVLRLRGIRMPAHERKRREPLPWPVRRLWLINDPLRVYQARRIGPDTGPQRDHPVGPHRVPVRAGVLGLGQADADTGL